MQLQGHVACPKPRPPVGLGQAKGMWCGVDVLDWRYLQIETAKKKFFTSEKVMEW